MRHERLIRQAVPRPLVDGFGRTATYLRLSVTDRCDLRCTYCMSENMTFLPRRDILDLEELHRLSPYSGMNVQVSVEILCRGRESFLDRSSRKTQL